MKCAALTISQSRCVMDAAHVVETCFGTVALCKVHLRQLIRSPALRSKRKTLRGSGPVEVP